MSEKELGDGKPFGSFGRAPGRLLVGAAAAAWPAAALEAAMWEGNRASDSAAAPVASCVPAAGSDVDADAAAPDAACDGALPRCACVVVGVLLLLLLLLLLLARLLLLLPPLPVPEGSASSHGEGGARPSYSAAAILVNAPPSVSFAHSCTIGGMTATAASTAPRPARCSAWCSRSSECPAPPMPPSERWQAVALVKGYQSKEVLGGRSTVALLRIYPAQLARLPLPSMTPASPFPSSALTHAHHVLCKQPGPETARSSEHMRGARSKATTTICSQSGHAHRR
jgi:hypothetical protein